MLQNIREGIQGPWAIGIVAVIVVSFVFTGVSGYVSSSNSNAVAIVNGEEIPANKLDLAYQNERARLESQFGEAVNSLFASENYVTQFRNDVLERLIDEELVTQKAKDLGLRVSDEQIKEAIAIMPEFQVAGSFDNTVYRTTIQRAGFTPSEFAEYMRDQMTRQQLVQAINGSNFGLEHQVSTILALQGQTRDAQSLQIDIAKYQESIDLSDEEVQAYYDANLSTFDTQAQVKLAYVTLSVADLEPKMEVLSEEVRQYYDDNIGYYQTEASRTVSHILVETGDDENAARAKAEALLARVKAGEDFAQLAEENSDDIVSAEEGGNLGEVSVDDYPGAFGEAVAALNAEGQVSDIVETDFGLHIIKLSAYTPSTTTSFEDVRNAIESELRNAKAIDEFFVLQQDMAQLAFEQPDTLEAVAEAVGRPIIETPFFEENQLPAGVNYPQVSDIAFSSELVDSQLNSDLLELSDNLVMVTRVAEYKPQRTKALDEVKDEIVVRLKRDKAQEQATIYAETIQIALNNGEDISDLLAQQAVEWVNHSGLERRSNELPLEMIESIFELSPSNSENSAVVSMNNGNVGVVKLLAVNEVEPVDASNESLKQRIASLQAQQTYQNFVGALRENAEVRIITQ